MRVAFCGAAGTGKTVLATYVSERLGVPMNPVGSRSVARAMGFQSPYDVDAAGRRAEFQRRLMAEKCDWESEHSGFVTDRTTLDNIAYTIMHDVHAVDDALLVAAFKGMERYTHVIYLPFWAFCKPDGDPARIQSQVYHRCFDVVLFGLLHRHFGYLPMRHEGPRGSKFLVLNESDLAARKSRIDFHLTPVNY